MALVPENAGLETPIRSTGLHVPSLVARNCCQKLYFQIKPCVRADRDITNMGLYYQHAWDRLGIPNSGYNNLRTELRQQ
jgi:hypothetical protein